MIYKIAEKFKSLQGEGVYAGTPMAFIRFVGCSVGKTICQHCDTDFDDVLPWRGGGTFSHEELLRWAYPYDHICFTGGEPLDQDLWPFFQFCSDFPKLGPKMFHIETSGTKPFPLYDPEVTHKLAHWPFDVWVCVSPKPGFLEHVVRSADEVKVIVPGLGDINPKVAKHWTLEVVPAVIERQHELKRWPDLSDAIRWAAADKVVFLQPRNTKNAIDPTNLMYVLDVLRDHPQLRLSSQLHKILKVQ